MSKFVHIDPSLHGVGGHEYDGALSTLQAAEAAGYEVALAASRRFRSRASLPSHWPVYAIFPRKRVKRSRVSASLCIGLDGRGLRCPTGNAPRRWRGGAVKSGLAALLAVDWAGCRRRHIRACAAACRRLFAELDLRRGDQVFFGTISVAELLGLANYLTDAPQSPLADWHLQFHDDLYEWCAPNAADYRNRQSQLRCQFEHVLRHLPLETLHLYNPTEALAAQYNQLGVATFRYLPHPVSPTFRTGESRGRERLHVTCAGGVRREKGHRGLRTLVTWLRDAPFFDGRLELVAQVSQRKLRRLGISTTEAGEDKANVPLTALPHPLATEAYSNLIRQTDIGLFLYDPHRYRFRCSAVLQEMLAAGKPVIVPAGCWLADQVAEPIFRHLEKLSRLLPTIHRLQGSDLAWRKKAQAVPQRTDNGGRLGFTRSRSMDTQLPVPAPSTELLVSLRREQIVRPGSYISVQTEQFDGAGNLLKQFDTILGPRPNSANVLTLHRLDSRAVRLKLHLSPAYTQEELIVGDVQITFLDSRATDGCPAGSVGLVAARQAQIPDLLRDMIVHFDHYRESAQAFSSHWRQAHDPARTIEVLAASATSPFMTGGAGGATYRVA